MSPEELALLEILLSYGYTEEQAMQVLMSGALSSPTPATPMQDPLGALIPNNVLSGAAEPAPSSFQDPLGMLIPSQSYPPPVLQDPSGMLIPSGYYDPSTIQSQSLGVNPTSGYMGQETGAAPTFSTHTPYHYDSSLGEATTGMSDVQTWLADDYIGGYAPQEKERSVGSTHSPDVVRALVSMGRKAAAQSTPSPKPMASSAGRSVTAPGQMKQAAGVQSARQYTPAGAKPLPKSPPAQNTRPKGVATPKPGTMPTKPAGTKPLAPRTSTVAKKLGR